MVYALVIVKDSRILREAKQTRNTSEVGIQQNHEKNHEVLVCIKGLDNQTLVPFQRPILNMAYYWDFLLCNCHKKNLFCNLIFSFGGLKGRFFAFGSRKGKKIYIYFFETIIKDANNMPSL